MEEKDDVKVSLDKDCISPFWSQFDMILCIKQHTDHRRNSTTLFTSMGIPVEFVTVNNFGRFEAHQQCLKTAYDAGCCNVVIFEDRIDRLNELSQKQYDDITHFIHNDKTFDLFFLGAYPNILFDAALKVNGAIYKVQSPSVHAYVASRKWMEKMLRINYNLLECPLENIYALNQNAYCVFPTLFFQTDLTFNESVQFTPIINKLAIEFKNRYAQHAPVPLLHVLFALFLLLFLIMFLVLFRRR